MSLGLRTTSRFNRDMKRAKRRNKDFDKLWGIVALLLADEPLPQRHRPHALSGDWASFLECHIEPDWLLIWCRSEEAVVLVRTGTHADLFG